MRRSESPKKSRFRSRATGDDPTLSIRAFVISLTTAAIVLFLLLPRPLVLPAFSLCAITAAACAALVAGARLCAGGSSSAAVRDLAGAFTIIGCAATILGEIEPVIEHIQPTASGSEADD
jgi:hypothetical protein